MPSRSGAVQRQVRPPHEARQVVVVLGALAMASMPGARRREPLLLDRGGVDEGAVVVADLLRIAALGAHPPAAPARSRAPAAARARRARRRSPSGCGRPGSGACRASARRRSGRSHPRACTAGSRVAQVQPPRRDLAGVPAVRPARPPWAALRHRPPGRAAPPARSRPRRKRLDMRGLPLAVSGARRPRRTAASRRSRPARRRA